MSKIQGRAQFPFQVEGKLGGYLILEQEPEFPNFGVLKLMRNDKERKIDLVTTGGIIKIGLVQISPQTDSVVIQSYSPGNGGLFDEALLLLNTKTNDMLWLRDDNTKGDPIRTVSSHYNNPEFSSGRRLLEILRHSLFPSKIPARRK